MKSDNVVVFTDGASRGNPGPGGWAAIIIFLRENNNRGPLKVESEKLKVVELGGRAEYTTNNRMELSAAIEALSFIKKNQGSTLNLEKGRTLIFYSDSSYLINGITKWIFGWQKKGWITAEKKPVENRDLWEAIAELTQNYAERMQSKIEWQLVGGHVGLPGNERCDEIATAFADGKTPTLYIGTMGRYPIKNILDISFDASKETAKHNSRARMRAKAYSYVSMIDGEIKIHKTWAECEARARGIRGAKYKKAISVEDELGIVAAFRQET